MHLRELDGGQQQARTRCGLPRFSGLPRVWRLLQLAPVGTGKNLKALDENTAMLQKKISKSACST